MDFHVCISVISSFVFHFFFIICVSLSYSNFSFGVHFSPLCIFITLVAFIESSLFEFSFLFCSVLFLLGAISSSVSSFEGLFYVYMFFIDFGFDQRRQNKNNNVYVCFFSSLHSFVSFFILLHVCQNIQSIHK